MDRGGEAGIRGGGPDWGGPDGEGFDGAGPEGAGPKKPAPSSASVSEADSRGSEERKVKPRRRLSGPSRVTDHFPWVFTSETAQDSPAGRSPSTAFTRCSTRSRSSLEQPAPTISTPTPPNPQS